MLLVVSATFAVRRRVCDDAGSGCFVAELAIDKHLLTKSATFAHQLAGPSGEVLRGNWSEQPLMRPLFMSILNGSCFRSDGSRKVVVDVGANIGLYSLYFARMGCMVHSVEPLPINAKCIRNSIRMNHLRRNLILHQVAVSQKINQSLAMRYTPLETGISHVVTKRQNGYFTRSKSRWHTVEVPATRLDSLLRPPRAVDLLKVDVEGLELGVLCSALQMLSASVATLALELNYATTSPKDVKMSIRCSRPSSPVIQKSETTRRPCKPRLKMQSMLGCAHSKASMHAS